MRVHAIVSSLLLLAVAGLQAAAPPPVEWVPGELIIKLDVPSERLLDALDRGHLAPVTHLRDLDKVLAEAGALSIDYLLPRVREGIREERDPYGLERLFLVTLPEDADIPGLIARISGLPGVEDVVENRIFRIALMPNDPRFSEQYGLHNIGQTGGTVDADIDAPEAWDVTTGSGVLVAVLDTGANFSHPDLAANLIAGWDCVNEDNNPADDNGHGTHVAGTIAAVSNNGLGVTGVCWDCRILVIKVFNSLGLGSAADLIQGFDYARQYGGVDVINFSGGAYGSTYGPLLSAVNACHDAGITLVAAMGNDGTSSPMQPASYDSTIAVGATDHNDNRWPFSNYGSHIDLTAPGVSILSTAWPSGYALGTGTSMATPHVAGAVALLLSEHPNYSPDAVKNLMRASADDLGAVGWDQYYGAGRLNARTPFTQITVPALDTIGMLLLVAGMSLLLLLRRRG
jgi:subtilisin family serine protease